jgi:spore coat protein H
MSTRFIHVPASILTTLLTVAAAATLSCATLPQEGGPGESPADDDDRPDGWTEETHGKDAEPDYATVFPQDAVNRIDITVAEGDWQAMQSDLTEMLGDPGTMGDGTQEIPDEFFDACVDLSEGDPCEAFAGVIVGTCVSIMGSDLACFSEEMLEEIPDFDGNIQLIPHKPVYVPCTVTFEERIWQHVGLRFKGNSTLAYAWWMGSPKLPLRLDFDEFEDDHPEIDDQRFFGFKWLSLASNFNDASYVRQKVGSDIFRAAGVPSPETAFYAVYVDHGDGPVYFGLYTGTEVPHDPMLEQQFGSDEGILYKASGDGATWAVFDTDSFDPKTHESDADHQDLEQVFDALHASRDDPEVWRADLDSVFDVDGFLLWLATNTVIQNWDSYGNTPQNYYLYANPLDGGRVSWIAWDFNEALKSEGALMPVLELELDEVSESWPLIRFLMDDPVYREQYVSWVGEVADEAFPVEATRTRYDDAHALIRPYVIGEGGEDAEYSFTDPDLFQAALDDLHEGVEARGVEVRTFLDEQ